MLNLTQSMLQSLVDYNPLTGIFVWKERPRTRFRNTANFKAWNKKFPGKEAGNLREDGYLRVGILGKYIYIHRLAWLYMHGTTPANDLDHINGVRSDNRMSNLREATREENGKNQKLHVTNTSGVCGVQKVYGGKWVAKIYENGKQRTLGTFVDFGDAVEARKEAEAKAGYHTNHGLPQNERERT